MPLSKLLRSRARCRSRIFAKTAAIDMKDRLEARGYRWPDGSNGRLKAWWTETDELYGNERHDRRAGTRGWTGTKPPTMRVTAHDGFRA